jgi:ubiquinone/menaquinone biosynthesis C-methylase UbiE
MGSEQEHMDRVFRERAGIAERYALDNPGNRFNYERLRSGVARYLQNAFADLSDVKALDLGSGELFWIEELIALGLARDNCVGGDLLSWRLKEGKRLGREVAATALSADQLPFADETFDLVTQFTMMTSVLDSAVRRRIALEAVRVIRPGGYILWYDFRYRNPANKDTRAIGRSELKSLFTPLPIDGRTMTLLPPLARRLKGPFSLLLRPLDALPILRSHYLVLIGPKG